MESHYDIVICGGGPVGLMFANLLARTNYSIALIDAGVAPVAPAQSEPHLSVYELSSGYAPRVSALNAASIALLERCDVIDKLGRHAKFFEMHVKDVEGAGEIQFSAEEIGVPQLGMVIENHRLVGALHERLEEFENVELLFGQSVQEIVEGEGGNRVLLDDGRVLICNLLVGADGGNSRVRELKGLRTAGWSYDQTAVVTTIQTELPHNQIPRQWFTSEGPLAFLPLADSHLCSIVWSHQDAESLMKLNAELFCKTLSETSEQDLGIVVGTDQRLSFPLKQQHTYRYVGPGVALIGDAAHTIHPLAGQGANLGLADAEALALEIRQTQLTGQQPGEISVLRRFERARQPHNLAVAAAMETLKRLYSSQTPALGWLRNRGMRALNQNSLLKSMIIKFAS
ncbi:MAG: 2-octaprenylphenol hydroxylase [Planctomycetaceae bacterium]|jgi:2-octaprenylphenol hydroxylase